jgi:hypothetical protein
MQRRMLPILVLTALLLCLLVAGYFFWLHGRSEEKGKEKFQQALTEIVNEDPSANNPCLGTSVLRDHSYAELSVMSVADIKKMIPRNGSVC